MEARAPKDDEAEIGRGGFEAFRCEQSALLRQL